MTYGFFDLYVYIFLVLLFLLFFSSRMTERQKLNACYITLLLFTVCRYNVGWDYEYYVDTIMHEDISLKDPRYAYLSRIIIYLASKWKFYPFAFIVFGTLHLTIFRYIISKMSINPAFSWFIYLLVPAFFMQDLATIRQAVGLEFLFLAFYFLESKTYSKAVVAYVLAILFHYSCVYGIFYLPLSLLRLKNWVNWSLFIVSFFLGSVIMAIVGSLESDSYAVSRAVAYLDADNRKTSLLNYLYYAINAFFLIFYNRFKVIDEKLPKYIQIGNFGVFSFNIFLFEPTMSTRLCTMFIIIWVLLVPYIPLLFSEKLKKIFMSGQRQLFIRQQGNATSSYFVLTPFIALLFVYLMIYVNAYNNHVLNKVPFIPYEFWWNNL